MLRAMAILTLLSFLTLPTYAQSFGFKDIDGKWHIINSWPKAQSGPQQVVRSKKATWNITYLDVTMTSGVGFDDATLGATRRATFSAVIAYVDSILATTGTADVEVQVSQTDGTGALASAGSFYPLSAGFHSGVCFEHLTTGIDPSAMIPDITATVDFGYTWNSDTGSPTGSEYDLFSVLLHEVTHGLGISSLCDSAGNSAITMGNPGAFTTFDDLMFRATGMVDLFTAGGTFSGTAADLISDDLIWTGTLATASYGSNPPIYAPSPFEDGSSLAHWDSAAAGSPVMPPSIAPGVENRTYAAFEIEALKDLGYVDAVPVELQAISVD